MASPKRRKTPVLAMVADSDDWTAGYAILRAQRLPSAATRAIKKHEDAIIGLGGWPARRRALRAVAVSLCKGPGRDLARAAMLLATDPNDMQACAKIAKSLDRHARTAAAAGWHALSKGIVPISEDPIKSAHAAVVAAEIITKEIAKRASAPTKDELDAAPIIDDWSRALGDPGLGAIRGTVHGSLMFSNNDKITTSDVKEFGDKMQWCRTQNTLYRLGYPAIFPPAQPVVRIITCATRDAAYSRLLDLTGMHTLTDGGRELALAAASPENDPSEQGEAAFGLAVELEKIGRKRLAQAWKLLTGDAADREAMSGPCIVLCEYEANSTDEMRRLIDAWQAIGSGRPRENHDPFAVARLIASGDPEEAPGVVVLPQAGGMTETSHAKEMAREFKAIIGKRIPLIEVGDVAKMRETLAREFPHAQSLVDIMMSDLVGRQHVKFVPTLLVGPAGCGKSRLGRRVMECAGIYCGQFDGAGSCDAAFGGTERRWSSGEASRPLLTIRTAGHANPAILIDEIDKAGNGRHNGNLANSILPVLERETACRYPDPYIQSATDISNVSFILTANDLALLPTPLKDRCRVLMMPPLAIEHVPLVVGGIVAEIVRERGMDERWVDPLNGDEIEIAQRLLGNGSVRRLQAVVRRILAFRDQNAARN